MSHIWDEFKVFIIVKSIRNMRGLRRVGEMGMRGQKRLIPKICDAYPTKMKLGTVIPYPKKARKNI